MLDGLERLKIINHIFIEKTRCTPYLSIECVLERRCAICLWLPSAIFTKLDKFSEFSDAKKKGTIACDLRPWERHNSIGQQTYIMSHSVPINYLLFILFIRWQSNMHRNEFIIRMARHTKSHIFGIRNSKTVAVHQSCRPFQVELSCVGFDAFMFD